MRLREISGLLKSADTPLTRAVIEFRLGGSEQSVERVLRTERAWSATPGGATLLADAVDGLLLRSPKADAPLGELVWTGPDVGSPTARRTKAVVDEMLKHVRHKVTIVGYSLFLGGAATQELLVRLGGLSSEGVDVEFIVDRRYAGWSGSDGEGYSIRQIHEHWPRGLRRPTVRSWKSDHDDSAKLHAKVMIVDRQDLLVTSANLTGHGLSKNLELGVRLKGNVASACADHFQRLVHGGFFDLETWDDGG